MLAPAPVINEFQSYLPHRRSDDFRSTSAFAHLRDDFENPLFGSLARMGSKGWMVWDRHARAPARLEGGRPAIEPTEEQAREIKDELNKNKIADEWLVELGLKAK